jgi:hypothetical protein
VEPFYDDEGEQVGWVVLADDGETYLCEFDGSIAAVWDDGVQDWDLDIEPGFGVDLGDEGLDEDPRLAALDERLDGLEQLASQPREIMVTRATSQADMQQVDQDMARQRDQAEQMIGRRFTLRERRLIGHEMLNDAEAGRQPDIAAAIERLELSGADLPDLDDENPHRAREARVAHMTELWRDQERHAAAARGEDDLLDAEPPAAREQYDADDREQRQAWMVDALRGATDSSSLYSSAEDREGLEM